MKKKISLKKLGIRFRAVQKLERLQWKKEELKSKSSLKKEKEEFTLRKSLICVEKELQIQEKDIKEGLLQKKQNQRWFKIAIYS